MLLFRAFTGQPTLPAHNRAATCMYELAPITSPASVAPPAKSTQYMTVIFLFTPHYPAASISHCWAFRASPWHAFVESCASSILVPWPDSVPIHLRDNCAPARMHISGSTCSSPRPIAGTYAICWSKHNRKRSTFSPAAQRLRRSLQIRALFVLVANARLFTLHAVFTHLAPATTLFNWTYSRSFSGLNPVLLASFRYAARSDHHLFHLLHRPRSQRAVLVEPCRPNCHQATL